MIRLDAAVAKIDIGLVVDSVTGGTGLNQLGGDKLTLSGRGFDSVTDATEILFNDGTSCDVTWAADSELECEVAGFDPATIDTVNDYTVSLTINGVLDTSVTVSLLPTKQVGLSVSPSSVSPVLSSEITVTLDSAYPHAMVKEDFKAHLVNDADSTIIRPLYVMSVDDAAKSILIKFPGAESGNYHV